MQGGAPVRRLLRALFQADKPAVPAAPGPKDGPAEKPAVPAAPGPKDGPAEKPAVPAAPGPKDGPAEKPAAPGPKDGPAEKPPGPGPKDGPAKPAAEEPKPDADTPADTPGEEPKPDADGDEVAATVLVMPAEGDKKPAGDKKADAKPDDKPASLDAAATIEEVPSGPMIEVTTSIQPLTKEEADSVLGTTGSEYFKSTFRKTLGGTNLTLVDDMVVKRAEPAKEFKWPKQVGPPKKKDNESECFG